jgi:hypothetical protein
VGFTAILCVYGSTTAGAHARAFRSGEQIFSDTPESKMLLTSYFALHCVRLIALWPLCAAA